MLLLIDTPDGIDSTDFCFHPIVLSHLPHLRSLNNSVSEIRLACIAALASEEYLMDLLVLKGGNALDLVHGVGSRTSLDLDYSIENDVEDVERFEEVLLLALSKKMESLGLAMTGATFQVRPKESGFDPRFGGFRLEFMVTTRELYESLGGDVQALGRTAFVSGPNHRRKFRIEISRFEYCEWKTTAKIEGTTIYVYSPEMIVAEKLRALCQQMPSYLYRSNKTPRSRDFYDIYVCIQHSGVELRNPDFADLLKQVFLAKEVPISLLRELGSYRAFHSTGWSGVMVAVADELDPFDFYFDYVVSEVEKLNPLWDVNSPG